MVAGVAKQNLTVTLEEETRHQLFLEAEREKRSTSNMLERILTERYETTLAEWAVGGVVAENRLAGGRAQKPAEGDSRTPALEPVRSASADKIAAAGTDGKSPLASPPTSAAVDVEEDAQRESLAQERVAIAKPRTSVRKPVSSSTKCSAASTHRSGWKCRVCGEMF